MDSTILQKLLSLITAKEAEAKIVGTPEAMTLMRSMYKDVSSKDDYLSAQYKKIIERANNVPQTVEINPGEGLTDLYKASGMYDNSKVFYDPQYKGEDQYNNISHELLHFLSDVSDKKLSPKEQHDIIQLLIGASQYTSSDRLRGYTPPQITPEQESVIKSLFGE